MRRGVLLAAAGLVLAACSGGSGDTKVVPAPASTVGAGSDDVTGSTASPVTTGTATTEPAATVADDEIAIDVGRVIGSLDRRLLGTNVPAWVGPQRLADPAFQQLAVASGATTIRMPGGSWSSAYDWLACENGDADGCYWTWAARPSDFIGFMAATGLEGMWTVSLNATAQQAAALVAFFNGSVGDARPIGTDRHGTDWGTVGEWASLRAAHGHPDPQPVRLWEIGNEVYAAKPDTGGSNCADFGWEDVWTCDGTEYVLGDDAHDGFLAFRTAMQAVDPTIAVGAVGVSAPDEWSGFGNDVIDETAGELDFYIVHDYPFSSDTDAEQILEQPQRTWPRLIDAVRPALADAGATDVPVAITEYGWVAFLDADTDAKLNQAVNALYVADVIGQMAVGGVGIANQWNFANGRGSTGADYGLIDIDTRARHPQYYGLAMWADFGTDLLRVDSGFDSATTLSVYASKSADGAISLLAVNKSGDSIDARVRLDDAAAAYTVTANVASAASLDATAMSYNGDPNPPVDLAQVAPLAVGEATASLAHTFDPFSITVLHLTPT